MERYDKSFSRLFSKFISEGEKFENLYHHWHVNIYFDGSNQSTPKHEVVSKNRFFLEGSVKLADSIYIQYDYSKIKNRILKGISYKSRIDVLLEDSGYKVSDQRETMQIKKTYNQDLTDDEIKALVDTESKGHTAFIKQQIARYQGEEGTTSL